jgi:hypothetical protein
MLSLINTTRAKSDPKIIQSGPGSLSTTDRLVRGLGWFSIALGAMEIAAPKALARNLGMEGPVMETLLRVYGVREIGAGVATLSVDKKLGLWARVAGDAMDIATLCKGLNASNPKRQNVNVALVAVLGITAADLFAVRRITKKKARPAATRDYHHRSGFPNGVQRARLGSGNGAQADRSQTQTVYQ